MSLKNNIQLLSITFKFKEHNQNVYNFAYLNITNKEGGYTLNHEDYVQVFTPASFSVDKLSSEIASNTKTAVKIANTDRRLSLILAKQSTFISGDVTFQLIDATTRQVIANHQLLVSNFKDFNDDELELECVTRKDFTVRSPAYSYTQHCPYKFSSKECGYVGNDTKCGKTFADCKAKGNSRRFGGAIGGANE